MIVSGMMRVPGANLFVERREGSGAPLLMIHGFGGDHASWDAVWEALDPARAAMRVDLRGFSRSTADQPEPFGHADDIAALLDALDVERCDVAGLSMGGAVALTLALERSDRVRRLILVSPGLAGWDWSHEWRALWRPIAAAARGGRMAEARELWWRHPLFDTTRNGPAGEALHRSIMAYAGAQWIADDQRPVLPTIERLHMLGAPTLLLTGTRDLPDFRLIADLIAGAVPVLQRVDLPDCGHLIPLEAPVEAAWHIAAFVAEAN